MTFEERLAELGVDLSDLPISYDGNPSIVAANAARKWFANEDPQKTITLQEFPLAQYILHLTDIIDRMETRIVNLTAERDHLIKCAPDVEIECDLCAHRDHVGEPPCDKCAPPPGESFFEFAGIPEDWRADEYGRSNDSANL